MTVRFSSSYKESFSKYDEEPMITNEIVHDNLELKVALEDDVLTWEDVKLTKNCVTKKIFER